MTKKQSLLEIHAAVVLFGLAGLFGKWLTFSPFIIVLGRVFFASLALFLFFLFSRQSMRISPTKNYAVFILLGLILAVHLVAFFHSIQISTVAIGLLSYSVFLYSPHSSNPSFARKKSRFPRFCMLFSVSSGSF